MSIIACWNRWWKRQDEVGKNFNDARKATQPRMYRVPDGLKPRILDLLDKSDVAGTHHRASEALWFLLSERCPETKAGKWQFLSQGKDLFLVEVVKPELDQGHCA